MALARDKFWLFGVRPHQDDIWLGHQEKPPYNKWSRITPAEGAFMLDVPNMMLINCDGIPVPFSVDAYGYAESFCRLNKVFWSVTGSGGFRAGNEEAFLCDLAEKYPNVCGAFMDDFFMKFRGYPDADDRAEALLKEIRTGLDKACRPMELCVVWYAHEMTEVNPRLLRYIDTISLWTADYHELPLLEERFETIEKHFPNQKKLLGIYMYSFKCGEPIPNDMMELQCELGLKLMKEGRLDGMIFEANSVMGVGLPSEYWLRNWIDRRKNTVVPD